MTHRLLVQYGRPTDPAAFDEYNRETHVPLGQKIPGVIRFDIGRPTALDDSQAPYLVATLDFESAEALKAGLQSPEGVAAAADVPRFASGGASLSHFPVEDFTL